MHNSKSLEALIRKIDAFIRMYYKNRIIKGIIYSIALLVIFFLFANLLEYHSYFGQITRAVIFFSYILGALALIGIYIIHPLLKLYKIGKRISYEQAAVIISRHFPQVNDKLINTLQLGSMIDLESENLEVLEAAIQQKSASIRHIPFTDAIDKKENLRKTPYALIPLFVLLILLLAAPTLIKEPTKRLSNYRVDFERPRPFSFNINHNELRVIKGNDLDLSIKLDGDEFPLEVLVEHEGKSARSVRISNNEFLYRFRNLNKDVSFRLQGGGFYSEEYRISVLPRPVIINYSVTLEYPAYLKRPTDTIQNTGDFSVPIGSNIHWSFNTEAVDSLVIRTSTTKQPAITKESRNTYQAKILAMESFDYVIIPVNEHVRPQDSLLHQITVIPDLYPEIHVETFIDSNNYRIAFFTGQIKDDYGFEKLEFHYQRRNITALERILEEEIRIISIVKTLSNQSFFYHIDFSENHIEPGDRIEYWFKVWDNDGVNGSKSTKSGMGLLEIPEISERKKQVADKQTNMSFEMNQIQKALDELLHEIDQLQKSILQKEGISWEDTNKLQEMLERQLHLKKQAEGLKHDHRTLNRLQEEINPYNQEVIQKQKELQKLFDDLMTDEMKKIFEELKKLVNELDRSKMQEMLNEMQMSNEELLQNLDRTLELFKQLEMEKMITEAVAKLKQLADEQDELANQTDDPGNESAELDKQQQEMEEEFEKIKEDLENIKQKNQELEIQYEMIDTGEMEESIDNSMNQSRENLQQNKMQEAIPHQKDASQKMKIMGESLMDMMAQMHSMQLGEDIRMIRKLLDDLIDISFDQEALIDQTLSTNTIDPRFNELLSEQKRLVVNLKQVEDSLNALAKRQIAIQQFVLREIAQINNNVEKALLSLKDRRVRTAATRQQFVMTSVNNLALMLSEAMEQMMQQMMKGSSKGGGCPMPGQGQGQGKPSITTMKDLQQQLNQQIEQMRQSMGKQSEGGMPQQGGQSMSEQFARMAAQQEALRRQMQQYLQELKSETGASDGNAMKAIEEMQKTEKDLVHKKITRETLKRQERILTRLLESESAEMEREREERRESREAMNYQLSDPDSVLEFYRKKRMEREILRTIPLQMNPFYRNKVTNYFIQVR